MNKVAILQSNYIPWKGYFDLINFVDHFVFYDSAQYTKNDWRNRNIIKTSQGLKWLTIPVRAKGKSSQSIEEATVTDQKWRKKHWSAITQAYSKAPFFSKYKEIFEYKFLEDKTDNLSKINFNFILLVNEILGITTKLHFSSDFVLEEGKSEKLAGICRDLNADVYLSGPSAQGYLDVSMFEKSGISVDWMDYSGYPKYRQLHGHFEHGVTILDLLFNEGENSLRYMKSG
ncbi:WbqC family protein [Marinobacter salarius]|uniref:WbqC family protein n=1 Tax=Marinobacter salarius TaxID=1420917 RepID=UPI003D0CA489